MYDGSLEWPDGDELDNNKDVLHGSAGATEGEALFLYRSLYLHVSPSALHASIPSISST